jgi:hypothetical protein
MINREHGLPVRRQIRLVGIVRSRAYHQPHPVSETNLKLRCRLDELYLELAFAGARSWFVDCDEQAFLFGCKPPKRFARSTD